MVSTKATTWLRVVADRQLPTARTPTAIALLAPGTTTNGPRGEVPESRSGTKPSIRSDFSRPFNPGSLLHYGLHTADATIAAAAESLVAPAAFGASKSHGGTGSSPRRVTVSPSVCHIARVSAQIGRTLHLGLEPETDTNSDTDGNPNPNPNSNTDPNTGPNIGPNTGPNTASAANNSHSPLIAPARMSVIGLVVLCRRDPDLAIDLNGIAIDDLAAGPQG